MRADNSRLTVLNDSYVENSFILRTSDKVFARVNFINDRWCVWYYTKHIQKTFEKLREALADVNEEFVAWYKDTRS